MLSPGLALFGLPTLDLLVIAAYFGAIMLIGYISAKRIKNQEDFFLGGRQFGKVIQTFAAFGQGTSADNAVGVSRTVFVDGIAGIWSSLLSIFSTPLYWLTSPWYRRLRLMTLAEFFEERYESRKMGMLYAVLGTVGLMAIVSIGISAMSKTVIALTPKPYEELTVVEQTEQGFAQEMIVLAQADFRSLSGVEVDRLEELRKMRPRHHFSYLNETTLIFCVCLIIVIYGSMGGLAAAFWTDLIQGVFIIILSVILLPFAMYRVVNQYGDGSWGSSFDVLHQRLPQSAFEVFGSPSAIDFTWYFIIAASLLSMANTAVQPNQLVAIGSAKDELTARVGFVVGTFIKRIVTILWGLVALFAIVLYSQEIQNPDLVWGHMTLDLLGSLGMGLVGLMIACLMSALMSTADCHMITASGLFTTSFYQKLVSGKSESHYVLVGRIFSVVFIFLTALFATAFEDILSLIKFVWGFFAVFAASFWLGLLWRRTTRRAAWTSILVTTVLFIITPSLLPTLFPDLRSSEALLVRSETRTTEREYMASLADVEAMNADGGDFREGGLFTKTFHIPGKPIYWGGGISYDASGDPVGAGAFHADLWLLQRLGMKLEANTYALNETYRFLLRVIIPFGLVFLVSLLTPHRESEQVRRFFVKMRLPTNPDHAQDIIQLQQAQQVPDFGAENMMFRNSLWEFGKFRGISAVGFLISCGAVVLLLGFLYWLMN